MKVRILYQLRNHPDLKIGEVHDLKADVAAEYLNHGYGEVVRGPAVETATAPPAPERAVAREPEPEAPATAPPAPWPLKTKSPAEYVAEHGDTPGDDLSPSVAKNLEIARAILGA